MQFNQGSQAYSAGIVPQRGEQIETLLVGCESRTGVAQVRTEHVALDIPQPQITIRQLQAKAAIVFRFKRKRVEVVSGPLSHFGANLGRTVEVADVIVEVEKNVVCQPSHLPKASLRHALFGEG